LLLEPASASSFTHNTNKYRALTGNQTSMSLFLLPTADGRTARNHPSRSLPTSPEWVGLHLRTPLPASSVRGRDGWRVRCGVLVSETVFLILCVCFVLSVEMTSGKQYPRSSVEFYTRKLHDKEKGTYMGRSPTSWGALGKKVCLQCPRCRVLMVRRRLTPGAEINPIVTIKPLHDGV
jgi:hypothetical protein